MQCRYKEKLVVAGDMIFGIVYPEYRKAGKRRGRFRETSEVQALNNERRAQDYFKWLIHKNYTKDDFALTLTFDQENLPKDKAEYEKAIRNYTSRVKRFYRKRGIEPKIVTVRVRDDEVRSHFHLFISGGVDRDAVCELWGKGFANGKKLQFNECGVIDLSRYISGQKNGKNGKPIRKKGERRWSCTRNVEKPVERTNVTRYSKAALEEIADSGNPEGTFAARYPGYWPSEKFVDIVKNPVTHGYWMSFSLYRPDGENLMEYIRKRNAEKYEKKNGVFSRKARDKEGEIAV